MVAVAVAKSPKLQESEVETISKSRQVCEDVLRQIAGTKEWMKSYTIKLNLASNSKTPIPIAMKLLTQIRVPDLRKLAKSKRLGRNRDSGSTPGGNKRRQGLIGLKLPF